MTRTLYEALHPDALATDSKPAHGGARPGSGRKPRSTTAARVRVTVWLTAAERDALTDGIRAGETISGVLRDGGLQLVRGRA